MAATAKYVIDIAAQLTGDETSTELDAITSDLMAAGKNAEFFQQAIKQVSTDLQAAASMTAAANAEVKKAREEYKALEDAATKAAEAAQSAALANAEAAASAANTALSEGEAKYRQLEKAATNAALALERAGNKATGSVPIDTARRAAETAAAVEAYARELAVLEAAAEAANAEVERGGTVTTEDAKAAAAAAQAVSDYAKTLGDIEAGAKDAAAQEEKLAGSLNNVKRVAGHVDKSLAAQAENFEKLGGAIGAVGGPLGSLGQAAIRPVQGFAKLSASIGSANAAAVLGVVGFVAVTAAVVALTAAVAVGAVKVAVWALSLADSARSAGLAREAFETMNPGVVALRGTIDELTKSTGVAVPELNTIAAGLLDAGVEADRMGKALKTAALAEAGLGKGAAQKYIALEQAASDAQAAVDAAAQKSGGAVDRELVEKLEAATAAADTFAYRAQTKLGGVVARQMQGIGAQTDRLESNFRGLFDGLNIDSAIAGMAKIVDLFDENSVAGKALKTLFEGVFQPIIDNAEDAATVVEAFYLGFLIGATKLYIAIKPAIQAIAELFGFEDSSLLDFLGFAKDAGTVLAYVIAGVVAVVGVLLVAALVAAASFFAPLIVAVYVGIKAFGFLWDAVLAVVDYLTNTSLSQIALDLVNGFVSVFFGLPGMLLGIVTSAWVSVIDYLTGIDLASVGTNIMLGMVKGIGAGVGAVVSAVKNAMSSAIAAAKSVLGIHSPSTVFEQDVAANTVAGYTGGIEDGTDDVQAATEAMLAPPAANDNALRQAQLSGDAGTVIRMQPSAADSGGGSTASHAPGGGDEGGGGRPTFGAGEYHFHFHGVQGAEDAKEQFEEMLTAAIEGDAAKIGAAKKAA
jgi:hypothetical protein